MKRLIYKLYLFSILAFVIACSNNEHAVEFPDSINQLSFDKSYIPNNIAFSGKTQNGLHWIDKTGENWFILTKEEISYEDNIDEKDYYENIKWHGYFVHKVDDNNFQLISDFTDSIKDCDVNMTFNFLYDYFKISDLNKDSVCEVSIVYESGCMGDNSPKNLVVRFFDQSNEYKLRGETIVDFEGQRYGGTFELTPLSKSAPVEVQKHLISIFDKQKNSGIK